jgi:hypothetical protein
MNRIRPLEREIFEDLSIHRLVLGEDFHKLFVKQAQSNYSDKGKIKIVGARFDLNRGAVNIIEGGGS